MDRAPVLVNANSILLDGEGYYREREEGWERGQVAIASEPYVKGKQAEK